MFESYKSPKIRNQVWKKTDGRCYYCGKQTKPFGTDPDSFCVDHVVPQKRQGNDHLDNLVPACCECNTTKSSKGLFNWGNELKEKSNGNSFFYFELKGLPFPTAWEDPL